MTKDKDYFQELYKSKCWLLLSKGAESDPEVFINFLKNEIVKYGNFEKSKDVVKKINKKIQGQMSETSLDDNLNGIVVSKIVFKEDFINDVKDGHLGNFIETISSSLKRVKENQDEPSTVVKSGFQPYITSKNLRQRNIANSKR